MAKQPPAARQDAAREDQPDHSETAGQEDASAVSEAPEAGGETVSFIRRGAGPGPATPERPAEPPREAGKDPADAQEAPARRTGNPARQGQKPKDRGNAQQGRQGQKAQQQANAQGRQGQQAQNRNKARQQQPAQDKGPAPAAPPPQPETPEIKPVAGPAKMKRRHWGVIASFFALVAVPWLAVAAYLFLVAEDQYASTSGFTVRSQEQGSANELLSGIVGFASGSTASDSDILYEFIQSQEMVGSVNDRVDLRAHYAQHWPKDWAFSIWPDAGQEDLIWYWNRMVGVSYDSNTGLIKVQVKAFDPQKAQEINREIVAESQARINALNRQAREDAMRYAQSDLEEAVELLKQSRQALTEFRTRTQIVDPETDIQTRMGVMSSLQQQLAAALVEYDLLQGNTGDNDPRLRETRRRIEVIRDRIATERRNFATSSTDTGGVSQDYPTLIAEFERLKVDQEYAEESYFAALKALEAARDEADRQSRYLATYITPTRAEQSEYPQRFVLSGLILLFMVLTWSIGVLVYYSIRDRS